MKINNLINKINKINILQLKIKKKIKKLKKYSINNKIHYIREQDGIDLHKSFCHSKIINRKLIFGV